MSSWAEIHAAARLLRVPPERLEGAVTRRVTVSLGVLGKGGLSRPPKGSGSPGVGLGPGEPTAHSPPSGDALWPGLEIPARGKRRRCQVALGAGESREQAWPLLHGAHSPRPQGHPGQGPIRTALRLASEEGERAAGVPRGGRQHGYRHCRGCLRL